jgi:O-antigen/teichoic acid export membrane protein
LVTGALTFAAGLPLIRPVSEMLFGPSVPSQYALIAFAALVLNYMATLPRTYLRALEASTAYVTVDTVGVLALLSLNVLFIAGMKTGLVGVLLSSLIVAAVQFIGVTAWVMKKAGFSFYRPDLMRMLRFGLPLIISNLGLFVLNFSDRFFLKQLRSFEVVGVYAVGYKFGFMMNYLVVQPFFVMWQSRMYAIHAQPEHRTIFRQVFGLYSIGLIYAGLVMSLFGTEAVRLMVEPKFAASQDVIPIVILSYVFYGLSYYAQLGMLLTDRTRSIGVIGAAAALLNLVLNYFLISQFGMFGAAWATVLSFAFITIASYMWSQHVFPLPLGVWRTGAAMAAAVAFYWACIQWAPAGLAWSLVLKGVVTVVFPVFLWKTGLLAPGVEETLLSVKEKAFAALGRLRPGADCRVEI